MPVSVARNQDCTYNERHEKKWCYPEIIDLEFLLHLDEAEDDSALGKRDRAIFLSREGADRTNENHGSLLKTWLSHRLTSLFPDETRPSPGHVFSSGLQLTTTLLIIFGLFSGLGTGFSFFAYTGQTPVNVFHYLLLFVGSQFVLTFLLLAGLLLRALGTERKLPTAYNYLLRPLTVRVVSFLHKKYLASLSSDYRVAIQRALGLVRGHNVIYGGLFYWLLFSRAQLFGIFFNTGLLTATFIKLLTSDLAFGWQSTLPFTAEAIHRFTQVVATPWSWLFDSTLATPTLAQIEGSRIILKEGIEHLATPDLIGWWPFLVLSLFTYGFMVRSILYAAGKLLETRAFKKLKFDTPNCLAVIRRMTTPQVSTQARKETPERERQETEDTVVEAAANYPQSTQQVVLVADDIRQFWNEAKLQAILAVKNMQVQERHSFMADYDADQKLAAALSRKEWHKNEGLFLLLEGWMPPLVDSLSYLRQLRTSVPDNLIISIGLVGKPAGGAAEKVSEQDISIWRAKIDSLGDPYVEIFPITQGEYEG